MLGIARKAEAARHDRHAVEKDAGKRRLGIRKYLALGHRSLYMSGNRTKESIIGFLKKVNRDACGRAGRPQFHAFAREGPRSAARLRPPPLAPVTSVVRGVGTEWDRPCRSRWWPYI